MIRRDFLKAAGASTIGSLALLQWAEGQVAQAASEQINYQGNDLTGWQATLGDGLYAAQGQGPVLENDIETVHMGTHSELRANTQQRGIMAHNITFNRQTHPEALNYVHLCEFSFRLPYIPTPGDWNLNAQTLEMSFFIWDGISSRVDYGVALQWILNPWMSSYGAIRAWTNDTDPTQPICSWKSVGDLAVDTNWHTVKLVFDYQYQSTAISLDGVHYLSAFSATPKPANWSNEIVARLCTEIVSIYPGGNTSAPRHLAEVRDWKWSWIPTIDRS